MAAVIYLPHAKRRPQAQLVQFVRHSKSLASMLPWLLLTGVGTLLVTGLVRLFSVGAGHDVFGRWMETWLTAWPIAFPIAYLAGPSIAKLAARMSTLAAAAKPAGLGLTDVEAASARATVKNDLKALRKRIRTFEVA